MTATGHGYIDSVHGVRIRLQGEQLIPLAQAAAYLAERTGGRRPHVSTLHRWACRGVRGVRLEAVAVGSLRFTSVPAIERFLAGEQPQEQPRALESPIYRRPRDDGSAERLLSRVARRGRKAK